MAMSATLAQTNTAINGKPTNFVLTVSNSDAVTAVNVNSITPYVTTSTGRPAPAFDVSGPYASVGFGQAQVNGSQFNVQVPAAGSVAFAFSIVFFGPQVAGMPGAPNPVYLVNADVYTSDGASFGPKSPLLIALSNPLWGRAPGDPPNTATRTGALQFSNQANSALAF